MELWLQSLFEWVSQNPGWMSAVVFITALTESLLVVGMIVPGAAMMVGFGALIASGAVDFQWVVLWAVLGAIAGDSISYWIGRHFNDRLRLIWPFRRYPHWLVQGEQFFQRHGGKSVLFGRFVGPVRALIPAVAGMMGMPPGRFLVVNVLSALLWAPVYLLPGLVVGASLDMASQLAFRLMFVTLLLLVLIWGLWRLIWVIHHPLQQRWSGWLGHYLRWGQRWRWLDAINQSLFLAEKNELRGLLTVGGFFLLLLLLLGLLWQAMGQHLPLSLDHKVYHTLQSLRTPWMDNAMILVTSLVAVPVAMPLMFGLFGLLFALKARYLAWFWLATLITSEGLVTLGKQWFKVERPIDLYRGVESYSFPSNHATAAALLFGFIAGLVAIHQPLSRRRWLYSAVMVAVFLVAFSRLYLGAHWLTDVTAGAMLGGLPVMLTLAVYRRHYFEVLPLKKLLIGFFGLWLVLYGIYAPWHFANEQKVYTQPVATIHTMSQTLWQQQGAPLTAEHKINQQPVQWAGQLPVIQQALQQQQWQPQGLAWSQLAMLLANSQEWADLPIFPQWYQGKSPRLVMTRIVDNQRLILRLWPTQWRLVPSQQPVWFGLLSRQNQQHPLGWFTWPNNLPWSVTMAVALPSVPMQVGSWWLLNSPSISD